MRAYPDHRITESMRSRGRMLLDGTQGVPVDFAVVTLHRPAWVPRVEGRIPNIGKIRAEQDNARRLTPARFRITEWANGLLITRTR